jgi:hypothetical protein
MRKAMTIPALIAAFWVGSPALADQDCWVPMADWQPRDAVAQLAAENGWTLRRIKIDDGCYEVIATDATGAPLEVKVNPATLEILEIHHEDDDKETHEDEERGESDHD